MPGIWGSFLVWEAIMAYLASLPQNVAFLAGGTERRWGDMFYNTVSSDFWGCGHDTPCIISSNSLQGPTHSLRRPGGEGNVLPQVLSHQHAELRRGILPSPVPSPRPSCGSHTEGEGDKEPVLEINARNTFYQFAQNAFGRSSSQDPR